jgi:hypothetical protein
MNRHAKAVLSALCATAMLLVPALPAGADPKAQASAEDLVTYLTKGKLKPAKRIPYRFVCSEDCFVTATSTLVLKGPNLGPVASSGQFPAGQVIEVFLKPNKDLPYMCELFEAGEVNPVIDGPYRLSEVPQAMRYFGEGRHKGKVVVSVIPPGEDA